MGSRQPDTVSVTENISFLDRPLALTHQNAAIKREIFGFIIRKPKSNSLY